MITVNTPFIVAMIIIIVILPIKLVEGRYLKEGSSRNSDKVHTKRITDKESHSKLIALKRALFIDKSNLKRPWYAGFSIFVFILINNLVVKPNELSIPGMVAYFAIAILAIFGYEILIMFRVNKEFFAIEGNRKQYLKSQLIQGIIAFFLIVVFLGSFVAYHTNRDSPEIKKSVTWAIEPIFEARWPEFSEGLVPVGKEGKMGFIDKKGATVIPFEYQDASNFSQGLAPVKKKGKWGYINKDGKEAIPFAYEEAQGFSDGIAPVKKDGIWSVINKEEDILFVTDYEWISQYHEGVASVEIRDKQYKGISKYNLIDQEGKLLFSKKYHLSGGFNEGCIPVMDEETGMCYFIDKNEEKVIDQEYVFASSFSNGVAAVSLDYSHETVYIDHNGGVVFATKTLNSFSFSEGLARLREEERYGFRDIHGNEVIPPNFRMATDSKDGMIGLMVNDRWGFIENPLPKAAQERDTELLLKDKTQIGTIEGIPFYAGELEIYANILRQNDEDLSNKSAYAQAFEQIKKEKAHRKYGREMKVEEIQYQIINEYYKKILLK